MKLLIFGAKGMLGTDLMEVFSDLSPIGRDQSNCDITNELQVRRTLEEVKPTVVINAAAYTNVDGAESEEALATQINGEAVGILARAAKKAKAVLVHYSTDYVFDGARKEGYREDDPVHPIGAYGRSKVEGERQLALNSDAYYLLRTSWLYGKNGKNFVDTMLRLAREKSEIRVVNDQHGKSTWTKDVALATRFLLEHANHYPYGIYHAVNEEETTWYAFACEIFSLSKSAVTVTPIQTKDYPTPTKRPATSSLHNTKMPPLRSWQKALCAYLTE
ncbi:MAG: dTDP-4-dehydrorhamnose reductase [Candidatus Kerfeldbacteria bacterium]|nr:dTDP-4-dehydrorhamnose reductase [Candidatus Kerfeldbacteria bacterium]